jgi:hypothetical protein
LAASFQGAISPVFLPVSDPFWEYVLGAPKNRFKNLPPSSHPKQRQQDGAKTNFRYLAPAKRKHRRDFQRVLIKASITAKRET